MPRVEWALLCDLAYFDAYRNLCVIGVQTQPVPTFPAGTRRFAIAARVPGLAPRPSVTVAVSTPDNVANVPINCERVRVDASGDYLLVTIGVEPLIDDGIYRSTWRSRRSRPSRSICRWWSRGSQREPTCSRSDTVSIRQMRVCHAEAWIMLDSIEAVRFIVALFASGVFWLMVLFFVEKAWLRSPLPAAWLMAALVMTLSALALFTVVDEGAWKLVASHTTSAPGGQGTDTHGQN